MEAKEMDSTKHTLFQQMKAPKNNAIKMDDPIDVCSCTVSSVQKFSGEDRQYKGRKKDQQRQMREWCSQQLTEKEMKTSDLKDEETKYSEYVLAEDALRANIENEEQHERIEINKSVQYENLTQSNTLREFSRNEKMKELHADKKMISHLTSDPFLSEETGISKSSIAEHRVRPDHFKGFSKTQVRCIYEQNEAVIKAKNRVKETERLEEINWTEHQKAVQHEMEEAELQHLQNIKNTNDVQEQYLTKQRIEQKEKQDKMKKEKLGEIENGFFQGFGTSCR
eukprot:CAMPEP_0194352798 /NCGR_PEP_ID=MMETSP0174-20130528/1246_1 /TAXON_ID=216777 /ORGANISM="Proboscia alata, Strain PI-D3" /LENGTH=280 /DNA_ID=CAMNT_0039121097 /DNA_START=305 /DNA_END=1147 /DNA_ORIENTATION=+